MANAVTKPEKIRRRHILCVCRVFSLLFANELHLFCHFQSLDGVYYTTVDVLSKYNLTLAFLNSSLNPLFYYWKMTHIRRIVMDIQQKVLQSLN